MENNGISLKNGNKGESVRKENNAVKDDAVKDAGCEETAQHAVRASASHY